MSTLTFSGGELRQGDTFTIAGVYKRRTFWQWLLRKPKQLQRFVARQHV